MSSKKNFNDAVALARSFGEMLENSKINLEQDVMPCMHEIEQIIQPNREFVQEMSLDFAGDDEKAMAYREAIEYNDGALFIWHLYVKNDGLTPDSLLQAVSFGWTSETYEDARKLRMPSYREDKFSFEPTDYYTFLTDNCADEGQSFDEYIASIGGLKRFIVTSILGYYGSNLARALEIFAAEDQEPTQTSQEDAYDQLFESALKKFGVSSPTELKGDDVNKFFDYLDNN